MVKSGNLLHNLDSDAQTPHISSSQSIPMKCTGQGTLTLKFYDQSMIAIPAYVIPELEHNLLSTDALEAQGIFMQPQQGTLENRNDDLLAKYVKYNNLP